MKVHDQDQLVKLLVEEALDPRVIEEEKLRAERHRVRVTKLKEHEDDQKRAKEIVDRISAFEKKPSGDVVVKLKENKKPVGMHKQINEFNKKIMEDAQWGESIFTKDNKTEKEQSATPQSYAAKKKDKNPLNQLFSARDPRDRNPLARGNQSVNSSIGNSRPSTSHTRKQVQSPNASLLHKKLLEAKEIEGRISSGTKRDNFQSMLKITDPSTHRAPIMPSNLNMLSQRVSTSSKAFRTQPNSRKNSAIDLPKIDSIDEKHG